MKRMNGTDHRQHRQSVTQRIVAAYREIETADKRIAAKINVAKWINDRADSVRTLEAAFRELPEVNTAASST